MDRILRERYKVTALLGQGAMGVVYRALDMQLDRTVALKALAPDLLANEEALAIFKTEARVMAKLKHPNLLGVYDVFQENGETYLVMEYVDGMTVEELIETGGPIPIADALDIATQLLVALVYIEEHNVVHRDIKPSNLMLDQSNTLKMMDFGLARDIDLMIQKGTRVRGTPAYMSPEQVTGEVLSPSSDLYSAGATLFEVFTGRLPFESGELAFHQVFTDPPHPRDLRDDIPESVASMIIRMMGKKPEDRPSSARSVLLELVSAIGERERPLPPSVRSQLDLQSYPTPSMQTGALMETFDGLPISLTRGEDPRLAGLKIGVGMVGGVILALIVTLASLLAFGNRPDSNASTAGQATTAFRGEEAARAVPVVPARVDDDPEASSKDHGAKPKPEPVRQSPVVATTEARGGLGDALLKAKGAAEAAHTQQGDREAANTKKTSARPALRGSTSSASARRPNNTASDRSKEALANKAKPRAGARSGEGAATVANNSTTFKAKAGKGDSATGKTAPSAQEKTAASNTASTPKNGVAPAAGASAQTSPANAETNPTDAREAAAQAIAREAAEKKKAQEAAQREAQARKEAERQEAERRKAAEERARQ
ncbi:MAG: protein kinase, partial [Myxococcota bacterium]